MIHTPRTEHLPQFDENGEEDWHIPLDSEQEEDWHLPLDLEEYPTPSDVLDSTRARVGTVLSSAHTMAIPTQELSLAQEELRLHDGQQGLHAV